MSVRKRRRFWILLLLAVAAGSAAWPGYRWWVRRNIAILRADCETAREAEDWPTLEDLAREWLTWDESSGDAWLNLGTAAQEQGDLELAADCLGRIPDEHPKAVDALHVRMDLQMKLDLAFDAEETAKRIVDLKPGAGRAHTLLIFLAAITLRRQEMLERIRRAIRFRCEPPDAYVYLVTAATLRFSNGYALNHRWLKKYPDNETLLVARAIFLATTSDSAMVFEPNPSLGGNAREIRRLLQRFPKNHEVVAYHLLDNISQGNVDRVGKLLETAPKSGERDSRYWRAKGWYHLQQDQLDEAKTALTQAVRTDRYDWRSWHFLATVLRRQDRGDDGADAAGFALAGKTLEREILALPRASAIQAETLLRISDYARRGLDQQVHEALRRRTGS